MSAGRTKFAAQKVRRVGHAKVLVMLACFFACLALEALSFNDGAELAFRLFTCLVFVYCVWKGADEETIVNPYFLFAIAPFSLMIYSEVVSPYYLAKLEPLTWFVADLNMALFLVGFELARECWRNPRSVTLDAVENGPIRLAGSGIFLLALSKVGSAITFLASTFNLYAYPALAVAVKSRSRLVITFVVGVFVAGFAVSFNKSMAMSLFITLLISYEMFGKSSKAKTITAVALIAAVFVFVAFPLKDMMSDGSTVAELNQGIGLADRIFGSYSGNAEYFSGRIIWDAPDFLLMPYMYLTTGWTNLQYVMASQADHTYGLWFLRPILAYAQLDDAFSASYALVPYTATFNTYTFVAVQFKDFGALGSGVVSLLLGLYVRFVYNRCMSTRSALYVGCYALVGQAVLEMFFSNHFFQQSYPFSVLVLTLLYSLVVAILDRGRKRWIVRCCAMPGCSRTDKEARIR